MTDDLLGHVALVTGATDGIGRLTASRLSARGATVLVHRRNRKKVDAVVAEIAQEGGDGEMRQRLIAFIEQFAEAA